MKCPKCGYVSHDYLNACRKCSADLLGYKAQMQLHAVQAGSIDLRSVLGGVQPSPMASGEFDMGESLFDSPMLVEAQGEDGFDISLDDDFSFTPSGMSLESLDGFELSNVESMNPDQQRPADAGSHQSAAPDTGYATVMMDVSGLDHEGPPPTSAGGMFDAPMELSDPDEDAPVELAGTVIEFPDLPADEPLTEPDLTSAELRSSVGRTSDLDLTSMELKRTTRDIEMMNQLQNEALSGDAAAPRMDEPEIGEEPFSAALPEDFPEDEDGSGTLGEDSGELILPSFDTAILNTASGSQAGSGARDPEDAFTMPDLPDLAPEGDDQPVNPFTEEISLAIDPLAPPEPLPEAFPSLQTGVFPGPPPEEPTLIDEVEAETPVQPAAESDVAGSPETGFMTTELELGDPDAPQADEPFLTATPEEPTLTDEQPAPLPVEPEGESAAVASSDTGYTTIEMDISSSQAPETTAETPAFPDLSEAIDPLSSPLPDEATIVDEMSPFASTDHPPAAPESTSADTGYATVELDISDIQASDEVVLPDLPKNTDQFLVPSPDEATLVDEPSPFASAGHTPIDFTIAPPNTDSATIELDIGDTQTPEATDDEPAFPDLPHHPDALFTPSPDEATLVDEPSPFSTTGQTPSSPAPTSPETGQPDVDDLDDDLDLELLFPDEHPPNGGD